MLYTNNMKTIDLIMGSDHRGLEMKHKLLDFISPDDIMAKQNLT